MQILGTFSQSFAGSNYQKYYSSDYEYYTFTPENNKNTTNIEIMKTPINSYNFDRQQVKAGILHFGVGNFHRAHEEFYINQLLADKTQKDWAICGAMLLPSDEKLYKALKEQNNEYTLTVCGRDGKDEVYRIGSLVELIWAIESPDAIIEKIADKATRIITLTITEGGYYN